MFATRLSLAALLLLGSLPGWISVITGWFQASPQTWYVRPDGGTRYTANGISDPTTLSGLEGQCDGLADAAYPGTGKNQHCAFNEIYMLWQDGEYVTSQSVGFPGYGWIGAGGDHYIVRGCYDTAGGGSIFCYTGNPSSTNDFDGDPKILYRSGLHGDQNGSFMPAPLAGTSGTPTLIVGACYLTSTCDTGRITGTNTLTKIFGRYGAGQVLTLDGANYVTMVGFDVSDQSSCGLSNQVNTCTPGTDNYVKFGAHFSRTTTNLTLMSIKAHGVANSGFGGPTGGGTVMTDIFIAGNASAGWNADPGDGTTGTGSLLVSNFTILANGCAEQYGDTTDALPYGDCTDDGGGGYGDGFGTATVVAPAPGWQIHFDQGIVAYNTQDGLDALHLIGTGSTMTITRVLAYGNMGQQIKIGGGGSTAANNIIIGNCNAMWVGIPGFPSGYSTHLKDICRASDEAVLITVGKGVTVTFVDNTVYSAQQTTYEIQGEGTYGTPDGSAFIIFQGNVTIGFTNSAANGYTYYGSSGGGGVQPTNGQAGYVNLDASSLGSVNPFVNSGSHYSNNARINMKAGTPCPDTGETATVCTSPGLVDQTWHVYGFPDVRPISSSSAVAAHGVSIAGITLDYSGTARAVSPAIGALEVGSPFPLTMTPPVMNLTFPMGGNITTNSTHN